MSAENYTLLQQTLLAATVKAQPPYTTAPPDFTQLLPNCITYAENRIYRDMVLLTTRQQNTSLATTAGTRTVSLVNLVSNNLGGPLLAPERLALITPSSATSPLLGTRVWFNYASLDVIDMLWPTEATTLAPSVTSFAPKFWALRDDATIVLCPTPDAAYMIELTGLFQPAPLSASNPTTYISINYPDLLECACMIYLTGFLTRNYGAQADEPQAAISFENQYKTLVDQALKEEKRRRGLAPNVPTTASGPAPAQPSRG